MVSLAVAVDVFVDDVLSFYGSFMGVNVLLGELFFLIVLLICGLWKNDMKLRTCSLIVFS